MHGAKTLAISPADVERLLPMGECIEVMAAALADHACGHVHLPLRTVVTPPGMAGVMALMPAHRDGNAPGLGLKAVCVFPANPGRGLDSHQGVVTLFDPATGMPSAIMSASSLTAIRTAAVSAVATRILAREDARHLAILGAGVQARAHLEAIAAVRELASVRVYAPTAAHAERFVHELRAGCGAATMRVAETAETAVRGADIVVTATNATTPVLRRTWLDPGTHVNAIGASQPTARELDTATVAAAALFVDSRESALAEAGELQLALEEGAIAGSEHIRAELGELVLGRHRGRCDAEEMTLFRSLGLAIEDLAAAQHVLAAARREGIGVEIAL